MRGARVVRDHRAYGARRAEQQRAGRREGGAGREGDGRVGEGEQGHQERAEHEAELDDDGLERVGGGELRPVEQLAPERAHDRSERRHRDPDAHRREGQRPRRGSGGGQAQQQREGGRVREAGEPQDRRRALAVGCPGPAGGSDGEGERVGSADGSCRGVAAGRVAHDQQQGEAGHREAEAAQDAGREGTDGAGWSQDLGVARDHAHSTTRSKRPTTRGSWLATTAVRPASARSTLSTPALSR